ncbi:MAG: hypothetical protein HYZ89_00815 [Candidatus Omnitrophica bacterium]|nr:hypothetical protein [Candidatus Omnitrophota bacterium]
MPVDQQGGGIGVHDGVVPQTEARQQVHAEAIVRRHQVSQRRGIEPPQERPQRIAVGEVRQPQQRGDQAVVEQRLGVLDPADPRHDGHDMGEEQIGGMIGPRGVAGPLHVGLEEPPQAQGVAKQVEQAQPAKAGQPRFLDEKSEASGTSGHLAQSYLTGSFVQSPFYRRYRNYS